MAKKKRLRQTKLIVGEGQTEKAFLLMLRQYFSSGTFRVSAKSAGGKGPNNVIGDCIAEHRRSGYDRYSVFLDNDLVISPAQIRECQSKQISVITNEPCIEALFLRIKGIQPRQDSQGCKKLFQKKFDEIPVDSSKLMRLFSKEELVNSRNDIDSLDRIIKEFEEL